MKRTKFCMSVFASVGLLGMSVINANALADEESAPYEVLESDGQVEIRKYPDLMLATTTANIDVRGNDGSFMRLFGYISGENEANQKIAMTTPVFMEQSEKDSKGEMAFVMPEKVAKSGPPQPSTDRVKLSKRQGGKFAVIRFAGILNAESAKVHEAKLREWIERKGLSAVDHVERAGYDAPSTPAKQRRNEILIRLSDEPEDKADHGGNEAK